MDPLKTYVSQMNDHPLLIVKSHEIRSNPSPLKFNDGPQGNAISIGDGLAERNGLKAGGIRWPIAAQFAWQNVLQSGGIYGDL